ncbi:polyphosphate kinase 2 family protein [Phycicoccus duodecadis]|uniref:PPK2 family polyphosphate:nucleotide phosphotransferase n=1 Tax=Phycicoccus duodecadis TaxID=173053 RepID=A0A2N3YF94_9MICO|nr:polyphosphate kinase 2 family protein [Phycicoccus duodecadis]PKW25515.1 PPK2 family polyphosphate:nucleotide phosphotransferase [Phycicoccus duodecadis]
MGKGAKKTTKSGDTKGKGGGKDAPTARGKGTVKAAPLRGKAADKARAAKAEARKARHDDAVEVASWSGLLRVHPGFSLAEIDTASTPGFDGKKAEAAEVMGELQQRLGDLQERLFAESKGGGRRSVLLVIQGMDTSGKGGIMRHVVGAVDPQGVHITSFKAPSPEERRHPFLWRIRNALPAAGQIGVFDRSHYEDVLIVRVHDLVPPATWGRRYSQINRFEQGVVDAGTTVVKVMLHVSSDEQKSRLTERLERGDKYWKYNPSDVDERSHWADYMEAYQVALERCSTDAAPWHVVPADRKWYARLAVTNLLLEALERMDPQWPAADFDVEAERERLALTP